MNHTQEVAAVLAWAHEKRVVLRWLVVEAGAGDGDYASQSASLIGLGWTALLVEPDPRPYAALRAKYWGDEMVETVRCGLAPEAGELVLHQRRDWSVSHFAGTVTHVAAPDVATLAMPVLPLSHLLARRPRAGIVSLDLEGLDTAVLVELLAHAGEKRPQAVIVEGNSEADRSDQRAVAAAHGYRLLAAFPPNQVFGLVAEEGAA